MCVGFGIIAVVVLLVSVILTFASRISDQAAEGIIRMDELREGTLPIWTLQSINTSVTGIWRTSEAARDWLGE